MFDKIEDAIEDIKLGKMVIVLDDEDRENEGDFVCAAECITPEVIPAMVLMAEGFLNQNQSLTGSLSLGKI